MLGPLPLGGPWWLVPIYEDAETGHVQTGHGATRAGYAKVWGMILATDSVRDLVYRIGCRN